jgi:hypothetical protein
MKNFGKDNFFKKEFQVQRIITPRLLLKLDFVKESYGVGDQVTAKLTVRDLKDKKISQASIEFAVNIDGRKNIVFNDSIRFKRVKRTLYLIYPTLCRVQTDCSR